MDSIVRYLSLKTKAGILAAIVFIVLIVMTAVGWYWSQEPAPFNVEKIAAQYAQSMNAEIVPGFVTTATTIELGQILLHKPGGYLTNDKTPPSIFLDNIPNWEFGLLVQLRDFTEAMREDLSRSQSQSTENKLLAKAEPKLKFDNGAWIFPDTESEYSEGLDYLKRYLANLGGGTVKGEKKNKRDNQDGRFYARADNLRNWLDHVSKRLGSISQRLSASVGFRGPQARAVAKDIETSRVEVAANGETQIKTPWLAIDDNFYEARGATYALLHLLKAIEIDFAQVLAKKNATASLRQIIRELEGTQEALSSPIVLNGSGMGMLANHSLVVASYISRANAAIIDLRSLLDQG